MIQTRVFFEGWLPLHAQLQDGKIHMHTREEHNEIVTFYWCFSFYCERNVGLPSNKVSCSVYPSTGAPFWQLLPLHRFVNLKLVHLYIQLLLHTVDNQAGVFHNV